MFRRPARRSAVVCIILVSVLASLWLVPHTGVGYATEVSDAELKTAVGGCYQGCFSGGNICGLAMCTCFKVLGFCTCTGVVCGADPEPWYLCAGATGQVPCDQNKRTINCGFEWVCVFCGCNEECTGQCTSVTGCIVTPVHCGLYGSCQ